MRFGAAEAQAPQARYCGWSDMFEGGISAADGIARREFPDIFRLACANLSLYAVYRY
jgi:hypothetical protein